MVVKRSKKFAVHKRGADGRPEGKAVHTCSSQDEADAQKSVLDNAMKQSQAISAKYGHIDFRPIQSMAHAAKRGLSALKGNEGLSVSHHVKTLAGDIAERRTVTPRAIAKMVKFFAKAAPDDDPGWNNSDAPSEKWATFMCYGGVPGAVWAKAVADQMERGGTVVKTINTSDAGSVGFGVSDDDRADPKSALHNAPAKFLLDSPVNVKTINATGYVSGVVRRRNGGVIYHVTLDNGGMVTCTAGDMAHRGTAMKKRDEILQLRAMETRLRFVFDQIKRGRQPFRPVILKRLLRDMEGMSRRKELKWPQMPAWWKAKKLVGQAAGHVNKRKLQDAAYALRDAIRLVHSLQKFPYTWSMRSRQERVVKMLESRQATLAGKAVDPVPTPTPPIKALVQYGQAFADQCEDTVPTVAVLEEAMVTTYDLVEAVGRSEALPDESFKALAAATYDEVDDESAAAWMRGILAAIPGTKTADAPIVAPEGQT